ncbi:nucleoside deaminase [Candidatus Pacearchaeota archaeon]|nr:nucleoside deaminase [Candidatus Pacearchaeota archaeon]
MKIQKKFMEESISVARKSAKEGDYAIGAIIVKDGKVLAEGKTLLNYHLDPTAHAEIVAIRKACKEINSRFLEGCILYVTHEPCPMCASAAIWAKMKGIVFGATIKDASYFASSKFSWKQINLKCREVLEKSKPRLVLVEEFMREECNELFYLSQ